MYERISMIVHLNPTVIFDDEGEQCFRETMDFFLKENVSELFEEEIDEICSTNITPYKANMTWLEGSEEANRHTMPERVQKALQCLKDNGIDEDECETVLQALGYILMDRELDIYYKKEDCSV